MKKWPKFLVHAGKSTKRAFSFEQTELPAALKLLFQATFFVVTVVATLWVAPSINKSIEQEQRRSDFFRTAIESLSEDNKEIIGKLTLLTRSTPSSGEFVTIRSNIIEKIAILQWRSFEFNLIFSNSNASPIIDRYKKSLTLLLNEVESADLQGTKLRPALQEFGIASAGMVLYLANAADVQVRD